jgi:signal transduction histidine kinase
MQGGSGGTGLGLSVTYGIIQEHAGKIRVESKPGQGTSFHMEFPMMRKAVNV